jgi:hypothetical protein
MKKWSIISSLIVVAALAVAAFGTVGSASAAPNPYQPEYCEEGFEGVPPYCKPITPPPPPPPGGGGGGGGGGTTNPPPPPPTCSTGQVGTYPNCVTPALSLKKVKVSRNKATVTALVNAPGTLVASGPGLFTSKPRTVSAGSYNLVLHLTKGKKKSLARTGKLRIKVTVTYSPTGSSAIKKSFTVTFKQKVNHGKGHKGHHK